MKKKLRPGEIRFTPSDDRLMDMAPYANSPSKLPSWFRNIGKHPGSLRRCAGTVDLLAAGVTLPAWTNFRFRPSNDGTWETGADDFGPPAGIGAIQGFPYESTGSCPVTSIRQIETGQYPKLVNPWRIETAPGWSTLLIPPYWEPNEDYDVLPAIVHTDYYHTLNIVLNIKAKSNFSIKFGTPLLQLIPFKRSGDFSKVLFNSEEQFRFLSTRGFGMGHVAPSDGTAVPYRRERTKVDKMLEEQANRSLLSRWRNR